MNKFILSQEASYLYSITFHVIEARYAGILRKTGSKVCVSLCGSVAKNNWGVSPL